MTENRTQTCPDTFPPDRAGAGKDWTGSVRRDGHTLRHTQTSEMKLIKLTGVKDTFDVSLSSLELNYNCTNESTTK